MTDRKEERMVKHMSMLRSVGISTKDENILIPSLYKSVAYLSLSNVPRNLFLNYSVLTYIISVVKTGLQNYSETSYSRGGENQKWGSYKLGPSPSSIALKYLTSLPPTQLFIPNSKLTDRLRQMVQLCFMKK